MQLHAKAFACLATGHPWRVPRYAPPLWRDLPLPAPAWGGSLLMLSGRGACASSPSSCSAQPNTARGYGRSGADQSLSLGAAASTGAPNPAWRATSFHKFLPALFHPRPARTSARFPPTLQPSRAPVPGANVPTPRSGPRPAGGAALFQETKSEPDTAKCARRIRGGVLSAERLES